MVRACFSWLDDWFSPAIRRHGITSSWCFPPGPREVAGVVAKLDRLASDLKSKKPRAGINSRVRVLDLDIGEEASFVLVMPEDADPAKGIISVLSPLGAALLAGRPGHILEVALLGYNHRFCVLDIGAGSEDERLTPLRP